MLTVISKLTARPDQITELRKVLEKMVSLTLDEEGCQAYDLYESSEEKNIFFFHEKWDSREFLDKHLASKHIADFLTQSPKLLLKPVEIYLLNRVV
ncbi:MAG: antibiotic biosynthesis monooxygenase [Parachlamydia sp.]|nr:MAG: antibiotic biosynthesis monooxygenase [Parachlamydia sp.]